MHSTEKVFTDIFNGGIWGPIKSGPGSAIWYTENLRKELPIIFNKFNIKTFLDAPCGDMTWMPLVLKEYLINYIGADIVKNMVEQHTAKYANERTKFLHLDICRDVIPTVDLWMCRDCLFHLSQEEIFMALNNFVKSDSKYFLTSTHFSDSINTHANPMIKYEGNYDIVTGGFRLLNLFDPPYNFPEPLYRLDDTYTGYPKREMCIWSREQIESLLK